MIVFALADDTVLAMFRDFLVVLKELLTPVLGAFVVYYLAKIKGTAKEAKEAVQEAVISVKEGTLEAGEVRAAMNRATATVNNKLEDVITATNTSNDLLSAGNTIATDNNKS